MIGYLYCLSNQCTPGLYKVYYVPDNHDELQKLLDNMNSGNLPFPYVMEFAKKTTDADAKMVILDRIFKKISEAGNWNSYFYKMNLDNIKDFFELIDGEWDEYVDDDNISVASFKTDISAKTSKTSKTTKSESSVKSNTTAKTVEKNISSNGFTKKLLDLVDEYKLDPETQFVFRGSIIVGKLENKRVISLNKDEIKMAMNLYNMSVIADENVNKLLAVKYANEKQNTSATSKSNDEDLFIIEKTIDNYYINPEYQYIFSLNTVDRSIKCIGKLSSSLKLEPLEKEDIVIIHDSMKIEYVYDTSVAKKSDFTKVSKLVKQECFGLNIGIDGKYSLIPTTQNKNAFSGRDMSKYFKHGQKIRHVYNGDIWMAIYNSSDKMLHHGETKYKSPTGFVKKHMEACTGTFNASLNGWKHCQTLIEDQWVNIDTIKCKE